MREKLSFQIRTRFTESEMEWLHSQAEELGVEISNIVRFSVRKMRREGGLIHVTPSKRKDISIQKSLEII